MKRERHYNGFWGFAVCRSPNGWLFQLGSRSWTTGTFEQDCDTTRQLQDTCTHPDIYYCPTGDDFECPTCGGFDVCCSRPERHIGAWCCTGTAVTEDGLPCQDPACPTQRTTSRVKQRQP